MQPEQCGEVSSRAIRGRREAIADVATVRYLEAKPGPDRNINGARQKCAEEYRSHLDYLCESLSLGRSELFSEYAVWAMTRLDTAQNPAESMALSFEILRASLSSELDDEGASLSSRYIRAAIAALSVPKLSIESYLGGDRPIDILARDYLSALLRGDRQDASRQIMRSVDQGTSIKDIYLEVFQRTQHEVGLLWHRNEIGIAQEHYCTACTQMVMSQLYPRIFAADRTGRSLVATCVAGDLHELGLRMVCDFFEMAGWDTFYLGANMSISGTLKHIADNRVDVLAISATMPSHVQSVRELIAAVRETKTPPRIVVGGAPFNAISGLWHDVGADGYARNAAQAIEVAERWAS